MNLNSSMLFCLFGSSVAGLLIGCAAKDQGAVVAEAPVLPVLADYVVPQANDFNADLMLSNEVIDTRLMRSDGLAQVTFTIWGYDELAADAAATEIKVLAFDLRPTTVPYYLRFSEVELQSIEFRSGRDDSLRYYITMGIDVDGDGQICNGDFRQDYTLLRPERFKLSQTQIARDIPVSEITDEICGG